MSSLEFQQPNQEFFTRDQALDVDETLYDQRHRAKLGGADDRLLKDVIQLMPVEEHVYSYRTDLYPQALSTELTDLIEESGYTEAYDPSGIVVVRLEKGSKFGALARFHEATIFKDEWYSHKDDKEFAEEMAVEYGPYEDSSRFLMVVDTNDRLEDGTFPVIGMSRMVDGSSSSLKTVDDMQTVWQVEKAKIEADIKNVACDWFEMPAKRRFFTGKQEHTWDISSLAVAKDYRNTPTNSVYGMLSHEMKDWALEVGVHTWTTIFVTKFFNLYSKWQQIPFRLICDVEPREHMGEMSVPAVLHLHELNAMIAEGHPKLERAKNGYQELVQGSNLHYTAVKLAA